jgi:phosphoribosylanthranilate isomerase
MFRVKICGITRAKDLDEAVRAGADAIGLQMSRGPRKITPALARYLARRVPPLVTPVGVFVDEPASRVKALIKFCGFRAVQLHGGEGISFAEGLGVPALKAVRMKSAGAHRAFRGFRVAGFLLDSYNKSLSGGTGQGFPLSWARQAVQELPGPVLLAGGLTPDNVQKVLRLSRAFGVDVSSGVESRPGLKDPRKVSLFIRRAKKMFRD